MAQEEQVVAEQTVAVAEQHALTVRISQHPVEDFWRVDVTNQGPPQGHLTTTVSPGDSFLMNLIEGAVQGEQVAWRHLASWGQSNLSRQPAGPGAALA
jgi:hypothetical protein